MPKQLFYNFVDVKSTVIPEVLTELLMFILKEIVTTHNKTCRGKI